MTPRRLEKRRPGSDRETGQGPKPATRLPAGSLRWSCPPLAPSKKPPGAADLLGQDRPMRALRTGLELYGPGYNVFVSGLMGTGRTTVVQHLLRDIGPVCRLGPDRVYVNNLREPNRPRLLNLSRNRGPAFRDEMADLVRTLQDALPLALRSRHHQTSRRLTIHATEARERRMMQALSREAQKKGCALMQFQTQSGVMTADIYPLHAGEPVALETLGSLVMEGAVTEHDRDDMLARRDQLLIRLGEASERVRRMYRHMDAELRTMDRKVATRVLDNHLRDFRERWNDPGIGEYLREVQDYIERDLDRWAVYDEDAQADRDSGREDGGDDPSGGGHRHAHPPEIRFPELDVHVIKTGDEEECPVVIEVNPTYGNLFGTIEHPRDGMTHHVGLIHPGALLEADGGYLILRAHDVLREPGAWLQLKRALQSGMVEIREYDPHSGTTGGVMQPEAIPVDLKVVMIGEPGIYETLCTEDSQFRHIFKVHAEFDTTIPASATNLRRYADYLTWLTRTEGLRPFSPEAAAAIAEQGARIAGRQDRLTTRFGEIGDLAREASHVCAQHGGSETVAAEHVQEALGNRVNRHDLHRELVDRDFKDGYTRLSTTGTEVGQVNALTLVDTGTLAFGKPCRITTSTGVGSPNRSGLINIEREAELSGPIHDKGVMILEGFLLETFGHLGTPCLQATICFEQLYGGLDGDSASCAELFALLSSLSGIPLDQGLAITGSVNQKGEVQAVSGVNEKVEGFFRLCRTRRLSGRQGVVLPRANVGDLMLDIDVVEAVGGERFAVHAIDHVHEGLELFTGRPADEVLGEAAATLERFRALARGTD